MRLFNLITTLILLVLCILFPTFAQGQDQDENQQETGHDLQAVEVINIQVPIRVFYDNKPVPDLEQKNFKLFVNGKEKEISGFYMEKRTLMNQQTTASAPETTLKTESKKKRLFFLLFNFSYPSQELTKGIDEFFTKVIQPGDRIMSLSNNTFLEDSLVMNPVLEKQKILNVISLEMKKLANEQKFISSQIGMIHTQLYQDLADPDARTIADYPFGFIKKFLDDFYGVFTQAKWNYVQASLPQYIRICEYLKNQTSEKWVVSFYQPTIFPKEAAMTSQILEIAETRPDIRAIIDSFSSRLEFIDTWMINAISKLFLNSGASFHTLLMKPENSSGTYESEMEKTMSKLAQMTGGCLDKSADVSKFVTAMTEKEDIFYCIAFSPAKGKNNSTEIKIKVNDNTGKKYDVVYDNQEQSAYVSKIEARLRSDKKPIEILNISIVDGNFMAAVSGIKTVPIAEDNPIESGQIEATLTVLTQDGEKILEKNKKFSCKESKSAMKIDLSELPEGTYDFILEVKDMNTWKSEISGKSLRFTPVPKPLTVPAQ